MSDEQKLDIQLGDKISFYIGKAEFHGIVKSLLGELINVETIPHKIPFTTKYSKVIEVMHQQKQEE